MAPKTTRGESGSRRTSTPESVEMFLASLEHPCRDEILVLRQIMLDADPSIGEGIKWNAPSFRTSEYFATVHLRAKAGVQVILHLGAKKRAEAGTGMEVADPESLLEWLAGDRATVKFADMADVEAKRAAFSDLVREWIRHV